VNGSLGNYYYELARREPTVATKRKKLLISKLYVEEGFRIRTKIYGPTHPKTVQTASSLSDVISAVSRL
jgi:hypothetical protein